MRRQLCAQEQDRPLIGQGYGPVIKGQHQGFIDSSIKHARSLMGLSGAGKSRPSYRIYWRMIRTPLLVPLRELDAVPNA